MQRKPYGLARLSGVVAGLVGLAVADLISWLLLPAASPLTAVGSLIINVLPAPLVNWGKETLGFADKPILLVGVLVGVLALCALGGQLELTRRYLGGVVFAAVAVVGLVALTSILPGQLQAYLPTVLGMAAAYAVLYLLIKRLHRITADAAELARRHAPVRPDQRAGSVPPEPIDLSGPAQVQRRSFLRTTLLVGAAAAVAAGAGRALVSAAAKIAETREKLKLPAPASPAPAIPAGSDFAVPDLSSYVTSNDAFYRIDTALQLPVIDPDEWTLTITGMVEQERTFTFAEILARPMTEHLVTLACVSNPVGGDLVGNAVWLGVPLRELLAEAKPRSGADMVLSTSHDGWTAGTPLTVLQDKNRQSLLAVGMNGAPLPVEHGFPARMVVPGLYGYVSATKWVTQLKVTTFDADRGYWTPLGWSERGPVKLSSRIDVPRRAVVDPGAVVVAGVAWAQHTGVSAVQVRVDNGDWREVELADTVGPDTWRQWRYSWNAEPGHYRLSVRAVDADGEVQIAEINPPAPNGATGYHSIGVRVRQR